MFMRAIALAIEDIRIGTSSSFWLIYGKLNSYWGSLLCSRLSPYSSCVILLRLLLVYVVRFF